MHRSVTCRLHQHNVNSHIFCLWLASCKIKTINKLPLLRSTREKMSDRRSCQQNARLSLSNETEIKSFRSTSHFLLSPKSPKKNTNNYFCSHPSFRYSFFIASFFCSPLCSCNESWFQLYFLCFNFQILVLLTRSVIKCKFGFCFSIRK